MYFQGEDTREPSLYISWEQELSWLEFHGFHLNVRESHQAGSTRQEFVRADCRLCNDLILRCTNYCRLSVSTVLVVTGLSADDVLCLLLCVFLFPLFNDCKGSLQNSHILRSLGYHQVYG